MCMAWDIYSEPSHPPQQPYPQPVDCGSCPRGGSWATTAKVILQEQDSEVDLDDREEGEFLTDEEVEEISVPEQSDSFFKAEDYQNVLCKTISALELQDTWGEVDMIYPGINQEEIGGKSTLFGISEGVLFS